MRIRMGVVVGMVALAMLAGCSSSDGGTDTGGAPATKTKPATGTLAGSDWTLATYAGADGTMVPAAAGAPASLAFEKGGQFSADTGCNSMRGTYYEAKPDLSIKPGPTTLRGCSEPVAGQETAFVAGLKEVTTFAMTKDQLTLLSKGSTTMTFVPARSIAGSQWKVTGVNTGTAVESNQLTGALTATFGSDGSFTASGGCNQIAGTYQSTGTDGLIINLAAGTQKACDPAVMALEQQYTKALSSTSTFKVTGDTLTLTDPKGAIQVTAQAA
jgi:heat shock protein HslJ